MTHMEMGPLANFTGPLCGGIAPSALTVIAALILLDIFFIIWNNCGMLKARTYIRPWLKVYRYLPLNLLL